MIKSKMVEKTCLSVVSKTTVSNMPVAIPPRRLNNIQYQYSDLEARPEKTAYFFKHVATACGKFIAPPS
jgi:hypothetical protein